MKLLPLLSSGLFLAALGCGSGSSAETAANEAVPYAKVQAALNAKCTNCHGATGGKGGVSLVAYEGVAKVVKPGDPAGSELVQVMRGAEGHKKMPPMGEPASEEQIKLVEAWIKGGAKSG
ncbi:hypothetical protein EON82_26320 [bacterium]|nr:MAG: hypothetical protein EON82_26320 [bacterium]